MRAALSDYGRVVAEDVLHAERVGRMFACRVASTAACPAASCCACLAASAARRRRSQRFSCAIDAY